MGEVFQFVSLILASVCLSWRRVMSDSHAAWHCRGGDGGDRGEESVNTSKNSTVNLTAATWSVTAATLSVTTASRVRDLG